MANGFSDYLENALLDWAFKRTTFPAAPTSVQISLHSADPGDTGASELAATGSYARVTFNTDTNNSTDTQFNAKSTNGQARQISNKATITFPTATGNWTTATFFGVWDAAGTNLLFTGAITGGVTVNNGNTLSLVDGNLVVSID